MLMKLFILAFAIIGIATRLSSGATAIETWVKAYYDTIGGAVPLRFHLRRTANCPTQKIAINRQFIMNDKGVAHHCEFCGCGVSLATTSGNCEKPACFSRSATILEIARKSWDNTTDPLEWPSIAVAEPFQVYKVDDGFCYVSPIDPITGRTMRCYARREV